MRSFLSCSNLKLFISEISTNYSPVYYFISIILCIIISYLQFIVEYDIYTLSLNNKNSLGLLYVQFFYISTSETKFKKLFKFTDAYILALRVEYFSDTNSEHYIYNSWEVSYSLRIKKQTLWVYMTTFV